MRNWLGICVLLLTACSVRPGQGSANGGSDVTEPLWNTFSVNVLPVDSGGCANVVVLLIGIGQYAPGNGWESLSSANDVALLTATLRQRGIRPANIHALTDQQATKTGIETALTTLADTLHRGRQLIVLYAGHARQLPDNNADEPDGYDEAIVPYDAPPANQHRPDGYLRDDDLNRHLTRIRTTLGPTGSLWLIFDSCHSQTLNRGSLLTQHTRGGIGPMGQPARNRPQHSDNQLVNTISDWYETPMAAGGLAPDALFAATTDGGANFETTDARGRSLGPLTRAVCEAWAHTAPAETYRTLFGRVAANMARFAPYQQPGLDGDADAPAPGCDGIRPTNILAYSSIGERLRVAWPDADEALTTRLASLPFVQRAGARPDLRVARRSRGYQLLTAANNEPVSAADLSADACVARVRQYFARRVLGQLHQTNPDFRVQTRMQRVAVQTDAGRTVVTDTLPDLRGSGLPAFRAVATERVVLTLTNTGPLPYYLTVIDLQPDGDLHVLLPEADRPPASCRLLPGQSLRQRLRMTAPFGVEVYKLLLTPDAIDLRAVLQTRGHSPALHPYEALFQRTYATRGMPVAMPVVLSEQSGATAEVAFWVGK